MQSFQQKLEDSFNDAYHLVEPKYEKLKQILYKLKLLTILAFILVFGLP